MCPFIEDLSRADANPEQPPDGAMSYNEFVRSRSDDPEMRTLKAMIDHIIANELRAQETRERLYQDIYSGRKDIIHGCQELISHERNASSQRVGFLVGHATAFRMDSEILTRAQTFFAGQGSFTEAPSSASTGANGQAHTEAAAPMINGIARSDSYAGESRPALTNGVYHDTSTSYHGNAGGGFRSAGSQITMTPDSTPYMADREE